MLVPIWAMILIAAIPAIATLLQPFAVVSANSRAIQPKASPDTQNPKNLAQTRGGWFSRAVMSTWMPLFGVLLNICLLPYEIHHAHPLTGLWVFAISFLVAGIFYNLMLMHISSVLRVIGRMVDINRDHSEVKSRMVDIEGSLIEMVGQLQQGQREKNN